MTSNESARAHTSHVQQCAIRGALLFAVLPSLAFPQESTARAVSGDAATLATRIRGWSIGQQGTRLSWPLSVPRESRPSTAAGSVTFDLRAGTVVTSVSGLDNVPEVEVWLLPVRGTDARSVGRIQVQDGAGRGRFALDPANPSFELDRVRLTAVGQLATGAPLLEVAPSLFERLQSARLAGLDAREVGGVHLTVPDPLPPTVAYRALDLQSLVADGEKLFFNETFGGNGRTCSTCHPAENNFTLDPAFIADLPASDPLFVAETVPALNSALNGGLVFENPTLMRRFGLIVENVDGFGDLQNRYVLRGVQHLRGLATTIKPAPNLDQPLVHLTGWGGDGSAAGGGSLRGFTRVAIAQHFPRTLGRVPGTDFRLPTPFEENVIEAFLLSLGRRDELPIATLNFTDARAINGRDAFSNAGACIFCHESAGANGNFSSIGQGGFMVDTGVEAFTQAHPDGTGQVRPVDGGFGTNPTGDFQSLLANADGSFGDRTFNSQSIVEMADTLPAFHSNLTAIPGGVPNTVEGAVEFYTSPEFEASVGFPIVLTPQEIADLGAFLRIINALDNLDEMDRYCQRALTELAAVAPDLTLVTRWVQLCAGEGQDVIDVLEPVGLHPTARQSVALAQSELQSAATGSVASRQTHVQAAQVAIADARSDMAQ